jgi:hypothetical protein
MAEDLRPAPPSLASLPAQAISAEVLREKYAKGEPSGKAASCRRWSRASCRPGASSRRPARPWRPR